MLDACTDFLLELPGPGSAEFLAVVEVRLALHRRGKVADDGHVIGVLCSLGLDADVALALIVDQHQPANPLGRAVREQEPDERAHAVTDDD